MTEPQDYQIENLTLTRDRIWLGIEDHHCTDVDFESMTLTWREQSGAEEDPDEWDATTHQLRSAKGAWEVLLTPAQRTSEIVRTEDELRGIRNLPMSNRLRDRDMKELERRLKVLQVSSDWVPVPQTLVAALDAAASRFSQATPDR